ncbi:MAG: choice-of-anchor X domain-containing protein [Acidobacteriota bacterium]
MKLSHFFTRPLAAASLSLLLVGSAAAQERLVPKQLAGPIDDLRSGVMAPANPIDTGIDSKSALIPVNLEKGIDGTWSWTGEISVDANQLHAVLFAGDQSWDLSLGQGNLKSLAPARSLATSLERTSLELGNGAVGGDHYSFAGINPGVWQVSVSTPNPATEQGFLLYSSDTNYRLLSYKSSTAQQVGDMISFVAYGFEKLIDRPDEKTNLGLVTEATLAVTTPRGVVRTVRMVDDGQQGDGVAGDGIFGASFRAKAAGDYQAQVLARGVTPEGLPFVRTAQHVVSVITSGLSVARDFAAADLDADGRFRIAVPVNRRAGAADKYRVFAEVWGSDALGQMHPVSWIGGMAYAENGEIALNLDPRWIGLSKARHSFELRNLRIEDPDHFIRVAAADRIAIAVPKLPATALRAPKSLDESMFMGPRPVQSAEKAGSRLLLVHGYCSGNVWGNVQSQFSNYSIFQDLNQNRSHDQFAVRIANFGSQYSSYGIVAHSQGGAAALHLYTYYWSGLDNASSGRLIQSVGTPYQGTSLAGNLAVLGQIFGVGCGTNTDLTYSGASSWLSGIPSWARNKVNYYTTSFTDKWWRPDWCQIVSDLLLSDPDDGTTERARGQLSSAVNRGHKTGWCHTDGMRDPNQTRDSGRNSTMNSNAAR